MAEANNHQALLCHVKWFDPVKGFGFLVPDEGGPDILLHVNVLRNAGRSNVADGVRLKAIITVVAGKWQAVSIENIEPEPGHS
ncbi:MAG: cold shock domain-containing protein [Pseudomonas sp.]